MHPFFSTEAFEALQSHWKLVYFPETDSTNEQAKQTVLNSTNPQSLSGTVFLTDQQNLGKGRRDNQWTSSPGQDLLFTAVIETELPLSQIHKLATTTALALAIELEKLGLKPMIKFPNDLYINNKKTAGILIEQIKELTLIGVGINVNSQPSIDNSTSLIQQQPSSSPISREKLLASFLSQLTTQLSLCKDHFSSIQQNLGNYDLFYGQKIQFTLDSYIRTGTAKGISPNGYLLVQLENTDSNSQASKLTEIHNGHTFRLI
ncbi:MAG: biotin--[acetyl-CoA-carboxylase] ligase [Akkermansiaceae bacterium]